MTEKIYKVRCVDGKIYLVHHGVSDYVGDEDCTNEKAIIQIGQYLNELTHENEQLKQQLFKVQKWLKILHDEHCPSLATIDGVLTEIDKAVNGDK